MKKVKLTVWIGNAGRVAIDFIGWLVARLPQHQTIMCIRELNNKFIQMRRNRGNIISSKTVSFMISLSRQSELLLLHKSTKRAFDREVNLNSRSMLITNNAMMPWCLASIRSQITLLSKKSTFSHCNKKTLMLNFHKLGLC